MNGRPPRTAIAVATFVIMGSSVWLAEALMGRAPQDSINTGPVAETDGRDWPMYGGSRSRNMVNPRDHNIPADWAVTWKEVGDSKLADLAQSKNIKWVAKLGSRAYGGPVVAGGQVYVGTNNESPRDPTVKGDRGILMCFRASDGEFLWQAVHDKLPSGQVNDWPKEGIASSPVVVGDRLYYVSNRCELVCASTRPQPGTRQARILWKLDMMRALGVFPHNLSACSPLVLGDLVFAVTANGVSEEHITLPAPQAPSFVAVNRWTGKVVWQDSSPGVNVMHGQWSNPTYARINGRSMVIFPGGDGWLRGFDPLTGKRLWEFDANPKDAKYEPGGKGTRSDFIASPVVVGNHMFIGTGQDPEHYEGVGHLWCVDVSRSGDISEELSLDGKVPSKKTMLNLNSGVVWHFGGAVKKEDFGLINRDYYFGRTMSTVAVHDCLVYASELAGYLHCLDARTGQRYWIHDLRASVWGAPLWVDGKVYLATEDGDVWIFKHGKDKVELARIEMEQSFRSTPVVVDGVLYLMTEQYLYAIAQH
jgi:outer membrane protein assembly factor BamB